jgi:NADH-quinone oxidoreductase subunit N
MNVTNLFNNHINAVLPELFMLLSVSTILLVAVHYSTSEEHNYPVLVSNVSWLSILACFMGALLVMNNPWEGVVFNSSLSIDSFTQTVKVVLLLSTAFCLLVSLDYLKKEKIHTFEYSLLILFAVVGSMILVSANDLISMYLAIEMSSLSLYVLAAFKRKSPFATEAGLKYFILGAFASGLLLFGSSIVYGFTGTTNFEEIARLFVGIDFSMVPTGVIVGSFFIAAALLFKAAAAPFHVWAPDVYEGAPTSVSTFFAVVPKIAILGLLIKIFMFSFYDLIDSWQQIIIVSSGLSMVVAAFTALTQRKIKRFLAYSSVGHVGYLLIGLASGTVEGVQGLFIYTLIYIVTSLNAWTFVLSTTYADREGRALYFTDLTQLSRINPLLAVSFTAILFSMAGIPPLAGFCAKMYVFVSAMEASLFLLAFLGVMTSVVGAFYYLRFIKIMYFETPKGWSFFRSVSREQSIVLGASTLIIVFFFLDPSFLLSLTHKMALILVL